jgi:hypothetical protein
MQLHLPHQFCQFLCVSHRSQWARGRQMGLASAVELSQPDMIPPALLSIWQPSLTGVGMFTTNPAEGFAHPCDV